MKCSTMALIASAAIAIASAISGCGRLEVRHDWVVDPPPRAAEATAVIMSAFSMSHEPTVYWYGAEHLDCYFGYGYTDQTGTCVTGDQEDGVITLAYWTGETPSSVVPGGDFQWPLISNMVHEFAHEASDQHGEGGCADHRCHWFAPGGDGEQATAELVSLGM
jgi:hypothetical protein